MCVTLSRALHSVTNLARVSEGVCWNPTEVGRGFYTSIGPEVVFYVKILCLLYYFQNYFHFCFTENMHSNQSSWVFWKKFCFCLTGTTHFKLFSRVFLKQFEKSVDTIHPSSCVLVCLNLTQWIWKCLRPWFVYDFSLSLKGFKQSEKGLLRC